MENVARAFQPKHILQELENDFLVLVDRAVVHGNNVLTATGRSLRVHQKLFRIALDHPVSEFLTVAFGVVGSETELLVERTDDMSQVW